MFYIVGLGNPGQKYEPTRHNVGWQILDYIREQAALPPAVHEKQNSAFVTRGSLQGGLVTLIYPDTFMNNSGAAVVKFVQPSAVDQLIVVHDDVDLPFGEVKVGKGRGDGGNNGIKSIIKKLGSKDFVRVRVGIAPQSFWTGKTKRPASGGPLERFVLKSFTKSEQAKLPDIIEDAHQAIKLIISAGPERAMNACN